MKLHYEGNASLSGPVLKITLEAESVGDRDALSKIIEMANKKGAAAALNLLINKSESQ